MSDILCRKCGEPWEAYYVYEQVDKGGFDGDEGPDAKDKFLFGQGCPACRWGTHCHHCNGTGKAGEWGSYYGGNGRYGYKVTQPEQPCRWCEGDTSNPKLPLDVLDEALMSLVDGTDEDVTMYLG